MSQNRAPLLAVFVFSLVLSIAGVALLLWNATPASPAECNEYHPCDLPATTVVHESYAVEVGDPLVIERPHAEPAPAAEPATPVHVDSVPFAG